MGNPRGSMRLPVALIWALFAGLLVTVLVAMIFAAFISAETLDASGANMGAMAGLLLGAATASMVAAGKVSGMRLPMCMAGAGVYLLGLFICAAILFDGVRSGIGVSVLMVLGSGLAVSLLGMRKGKRVHHKLPKVRK